MQIEEIKEKMKPGDLDTAAKLVEISANNASQVLKRPSSKHYQKLTEALTKVITIREKLLSQVANAQ